MTFRSSESAKGTVSTSFIQLPSILLDKSLPLEEVFP